MHSYGCMHNPSDRAAMAYCILRCVFLQSSHVAAVQSVQGKSYAVIPPRRLEALPDRSERSKQPLKANDPWFVTVQQVRPHPAR